MPYIILYSNTFPHVHEHVWPAPPIRAVYGRSGGTLQRPRLKAFRWQPVMQNPWRRAQQGLLGSWSAQTATVGSADMGLSENDGPRKIHWLRKPQVPNLKIWQFKWGNINSVYASFRSTQPLDQNRVPPGCLMIHRFKASEFFDLFFWLLNWNSLRIVVWCAEMWRCPF